MESTSLLVVPQIGEQVGHHAFRRITIEPVMLLYFMYYSGSSTLVSQFVHNQLEKKDNRFSNLTSCSVNDAQSEASIWLMYINIAAMIPSFFSTILLGGYSDHASRKTAIVPPLVGASVRLLILIFVFAFNLHLGFLILSSLSDGIGGGTSTLLMACFSYISDVTNSLHRSRRVVVLDVCASVAFIISLFGSGYAITYLGFLWTFVILLAVIFLALVYVVFLLPETDVQPPPDGDTSCTRLFTSRHFTRLIALYAKTGTDHVTQRHCKLRFCLVMVGLVSGILHGRMDVLTLFMLAPPLCFSPVWIGYFNAVFFIVQSALTMLASHLLVKRFGDLKMVVVGLMSGMGCMLMIGSATSTPVLFLSPSAMSLNFCYFSWVTLMRVCLLEKQLAEWTTTAPVLGCLLLLPIALIRSYSSKIVQPSALGSMFAAIACFQTLGSVFGNIMQNAIMAATAGVMEGLVFYIDAALYALAAMMVIGFIFWLPHQQTSNEGSNEENLKN